MIPECMIGNINVCLGEKEGGCELSLKLSKMFHWIREFNVCRKTFYNT